MAEEEKAKAEQKTAEKQDTDEKSKGGGMLQWVILGGILIIMMALGFILGGFLGGPPKQAEAQQTTNPKDQGATEALFTGGGAQDEQSGWFYDLEPVATNLSEPGSTRYVRAALTLEIVPQAEEGKTREFLNRKKPIISNVLNIYFAGLSIDDLNSDKNLRRIQYELMNILNESLCPNSKPLIKQILFQEFGVQ